MNFINRFQKKIWKTIWDKRGRDETEAISGGRSHRGPYKNYLEAIFKDINDNLDFRPGDVVLDIGCAGGYFVNKISKSVKFAIGIDASLTMIETAKKYNQQNNNTFFIVCDAKNLPFADSAFPEYACIVFSCILADFRMP